jgi:hypothetical protein
MIKLSMFKFETSLAFQGAINLFFLIFGIIVVEFTTILMTGSVEIDRNLKIMFYLLFF